MDEFVDMLGSKRKNLEIIKKISSLPSSYIGGKKRLLPHIIGTLDNEQIKFDSVFDAFSGSAIVSLLFKSLGKRVYCNDLLTSSAITAAFLLEIDDITLTSDDIKFLCLNRPDDCNTFVMDHYKDKFFTEKECRFLDRYRKNLDNLCGRKFYCALEFINKASLLSIPNSNFSIYGKDLKSLRSTHDANKVFWKEKWRDTTRKRRDANNEIMFSSSVVEVYKKYRKALPVLSMYNKINKYEYSGVKCYDGREIMDLECRLGRIKDNIDKATTHNEQCNVFSSDIIDLLESKMINADLLYLDPPYGNASSNYVFLYKFLEEYLYGLPIAEIEHIQRGAKRFIKNKGYQSEFEKLLSLCNCFNIWLISYNASSYASIDTIVSTIKNAGKKSVKVFDIPIIYQYRSDKHSQKGTEYLILAT